MACNFVAIGHYLLDQTRISFCHPSQHEERASGVVLVEEIQQPLGAEGAAVVVLDTRRS